MNKTFKIYGVLLLVVLLVLALLQVNKKETVDWRKNFNVKKKTPFGLFVFDQEVEKLFKNKIKKSEIAPYDYYNPKDTASHNILIIEKDLDRESWKKVLSKVSKGSNLMVISELMPDQLLDTLQTYQTTEYFEKSALKLTDSKFKNDFVNVDKLPSNSNFEYLQPETDILGYTVVENKKNTAHFIAKKFGKGKIYLHTEPLFLTNYYLLKPNNKAYVEDVFSYLDDRNVVWFVDNNKKDSQSPLRFILANPPLKYAWWLLLAGILLFILFNAKRKQRIVPIIEPLKNTSVEFVKSIGNLYLQEGDFQDMMSKKSQYFLSKIRIDLLLDTKVLDENFEKKLQLKTGKPKELIAEAVDLIKKSQDPYASLMREDLVRLNTILNQILK